LVRASLAVCCALLVMAESASAAGFTAYVTSSSTGNVTPISTLTNTAGNPIATTSPVAIAITPDGKTAYVVNNANDLQDGTVTPIDLATGATGAPIAAGKDPVAIAITPNGATAYVVNGVGVNKVTPITIATNKAQTPISLPAGTNPDAIAITPDGTSAYVVGFNGGTNDAGSVIPITLSTGKANPAISAGNNPGTIAITPNGTTAYVTSPGFSGGHTNIVTPIAIATNTAGTPIAVGNVPEGIAITPDGQTAYVTDNDDGTVTPITLATNTPDNPIDLGVETNPTAIAITPDGETAYVVDSDGVVPITLATGTPGNPIPVSGAQHIAIAPPPPLATTTTVGCAAGSVSIGSSVSCTVQVSNGTSSPPTGVATLHSSASGSFTACNLVAGADDTAGCTFTYTPLALGPGSSSSDTITGSYSGDKANAASSGTTTLTLTPAVTSTTVSCSSASTHVDNPVNCNVQVSYPQGVHDLPSGGIPMHSSGSGSFTACRLGPAHGTSADCSTKYTPSGVGSQSRVDTITARFRGNASNATSSDTTTMKVLAAEKPIVSKLSLSGVAKRAARLSLTVAAGLEAPALKSLVLTPPRGISLSRVHKLLSKGIAVRSVAGGKLEFLAKVAHGALTITLAQAAAKLKLVIAFPALVVSQTLAREAAHGKVKTLTFKLDVTDTSGHTTKFTLKAKPKNA
jgi:DNA-binding beta-propeller fold protein YncE